MADRRKQQNFQAIPQYLTEEMWSSFSRRSQERSRCILLQHSWNLGMRCPSESSFAVLYNLLHLTSCQQGRVISSFQKYQELQQVKKEWKKYKIAKRHEDFLYTDYLEVLPQDVRQLPAEYYLIAFQHDVPVLPRSSSQHYSLVKISTPVFSPACLSVITDFLNDTCLSCSSINLSGLPMDDLLMAVGATRMRWPKDQASEPESTTNPSDGMSHLMELAFRMGQTSAARSVHSGTPSSVASARPSFPLLALEDDPNRRHPQDRQLDAFFATDHEAV